MDFDVAQPRVFKRGVFIDDFMRPDRVVIGCEEERAKNILKLSTLYLLETPILFTKRETAEMIVQQILF